MTVGKGIGIYAVFLIGMFILLKLWATVLGFPGWIPFLAYLAFGVLLSRLVHRELIDWHPVHRTINNVFGTKIRALIFWPVSYPVLFFKLGFNRFL